MGFVPDPSEIDTFRPNFDTLMAKKLDSGSGDADGIDSELDASGFRSRHQKLLAKHAFIEERDSDNSEEREDLDETAPEINRYVAAEVTLGY